MPDALGSPIREQALQLVQSLPVDASWDDLMYRIYVRQAIESGIHDADSERTIETADLRKEFGLAP